MPDPLYSDAEIDAALTAIAAPERLAQAQDLVTRAAPSLQRVLGAALQQGGWFDSAHAQAVREAAGCDDLQERVRAVQTLLAEETRLGMLVGVAVGYELARELGPGPPPGPHPGERPQP
ncbi:MAG: hypothetical protein M3Z27_02070 [Actinomycetota bacterium]|nr:hypothetical protein [Actinomycetota bacterium]